MRLIDADALENKFGISDEDILALDEIRHAPTVDAEVVVRCKDCKHCAKGKRGLWCTLHDDMYAREDYFCACGEKKEGADNG